MPRYLRLPEMMKRILYFDHTAKLGGGEIALWNLLQRLDRERYHPVVVLGADGPLRGKIEQLGIEVHVVPLAAEVAETRKDTLGFRGVLRIKQAVLALIYCFRLARFIRRSRADLVHTNSLKADILGGVAAHLARTRVAWHVRDRIEGDYLPVAAVRVFRWLCLWLPHYVIANSQATLNTLALPTDPGLRSSVVYLGVLLKKMLSSSEKEGWTPKWGFVVHDGVFDTSEVVAKKRAMGPPVVVLVGRLAEWKGQHIFIQAAARVRGRLPEARFQIIGSAMFGEEEYEKRIRAQAADLGMEDSIEFTGFRADVAHLIGASDILVHASITGEPFGQVVIEAMAAGKPVVATDGGGIPEIVRDGETGILVPMGDAAAMADAVVRLLLDPATALAMGQAGRRRVRDHFTVSHTAQKVEAIYDRIFGISTGSQGPRLEDPTEHAESEPAEEQPGRLKAGTPKAEGFSAV